MLHAHRCPYIVRENILRIYDATRHRNESSFLHGELNLTSKRTKLAFVVDKTRKLTWFKLKYGHQFHGIKKNEINPTTMY